LAAELTYTNLADAPEVGGLTADDFIGLNADLTRPIPSASSR
jgi:hypothetical protein